MTSKLRFRFAFKAALVACCALPLNQAISQGTPAWVGPTLIEMIIVQPNGNIYVKVEASTPDLGCTGNEDGYLQLNTGYPYFDQQFSTLLAAHAGNRQITIYVAQCGYYPYLQNVRYLQ